MPKSTVIPAVKKTRPRGLKYWIGFVITLTIATIIGQLFGDKLVELIKFGKTSKNVLEQNGFPENMAGMDYQWKHPIN